MWRDAINRIREYEEVNGPIIRRGLEKRISCQPHKLKTGGSTPPSAIMDSKPATIEHIGEVRTRLMTVCRALMQRAIVHDASKLESPEKEIFDEFTPRLKASTYGSDEYKGFLQEMKVGVDHHYAKNSHHPEHYPDGVRGMSLLDVIEMLCDWKAATLRHADGDIRTSIEASQVRFGFSDELKQILLNTLKEIEPQVSDTGG